MILNIDNIGPLMWDFKFNYHDYISKEDVDRLEEIAAMEDVDLMDNFHYCVHRGVPIAAWQEDTGNNHTKVKQCFLKNIHIVGLIGPHNSTITVYPTNKLLADMLCMGQLYKEQYPKSEVLPYNEHGNIQLIPKVKDLRACYGLSLIEAKNAAEMIWFYEENRP